MANFKGKNTSRNLKFLFQQRAKYYSKALINPETDERYNSVEDINNFERVMFGRVDPQMNSIFPKQEKIKVGEQSVGIDFAVDAIEGFISDYHQTLLQVDGTIPVDFGDAFLTNIKIYRSYENPLVKYQKYISAYMARFISTIKTKNNSNNITDFHDFVNHFLEFLKRNTPDSPFTMVGWQQSGRSSIFSSGLAFSIADLNCGNDEDKEQFIINSTNFELFQNIASNHGINISLICPWILFVNPQSTSSNMAEYLSNNNVLSNGSVWRSSYERVYRWDKDIINLINTLILYYKQFITNNSYIKELLITGDKVIQNVEERNISITSEQIRSNYSDLEFMLLYAKIRNMEENSIFGPAAMDRIEKKSTFFYNKLDKHQALSYINDQFRFSYLQKPGGLNDFLNRQHKATIAEIDSEE